MADPTNVIQHDFGFPRIVRSEDAEREALYAMLVSLGATKMMAERLMRDYPHHASHLGLIRLEPARPGDEENEWDATELYYPVYPVPITGTPQDRTAGD